MTYNLHVIIRFELELELLEGTLTVAGLPEAWRAKYADLLGVDVPNDCDGVLQDVHWFSGPVGGAFQGYTLGNVLSAQFYEAACRVHPGIPAEIENGNFRPLYGWTREHIHRHGRVHDPGDLVQRVCGTGPQAGPYLRYLREKYGELYA